MQPNSGYSPDDFAQPAFCRSCGVHVPKTYLASSGGLCPNCMRAVQQTQGIQPMMPYPGMYPVARPSFFRSSGCWASLVGFVSLGLLAWGMVHYLNLGALGTHSHHVIGISDQVSKGANTLVEENVDDSIDSDLREMASKVIADGFGQDAVNPYGIGTTAVRDKRTDVTTYYAGGEFDCLIGKDREHVTWKVGFRKEQNGQWSMVSKEASYPSYDGVAQFDWDVKKFIHLVP